MKKYTLLGIVLLTVFAILSACSTLAVKGDKNSITDTTNPTDNITSLSQRESNTAGSILTETEQNDSQKVNQDEFENPIIWWADLHHNGTEDKIAVEIINNYATSEGAKVSIYKSDTDLLIHSFSADLPHAGWNGLYLYSNESGAYLMNWTPGMWQGRGSYFYEVFYFDENDEKIFFYSSSLEFDSDDLRVKYEGWVEFIKYTHIVNSYLVLSWVIADTDGGTLIYSTHDNQMVNHFYPPAHLFFPEGY